MLIGVRAVTARGRSPLELVSLACLVGTIGCALLAFALFPRFVHALRGLGWLTVVAASLLSVGVVWSTWQLPPEQLQIFANPGDALEPTNLAVNWSLVMLTCSISLITTRLLSNQASQHHFQPAGVVQAIFLLFWRQHRLVGWMALALSAAHSAYFLLYPRAFQEQWTGLVAFALLGLLGLVGLVTSYRARLALWTHRAIAAILAIVLTLHWPPILYLEAGALLILAITALVNLKLATVIVHQVLGVKPEL
ncbi:MAG: hypothetical protein JO352_30010 [Chloroflexi bacterium]|nr:hypothetical protein [Chloroflexota bacterium]MBV9600832.1 hypothetical protein [Chloroflexota bacterium]